MRYTLTVEVPDTKSAEIVPFDLLTGPERPKVYSSTASQKQPTASQKQMVAAVTPRSINPPQSASAPPVSRPAPASPGFRATHTLKRDIALFSDSGPQRTPLGSLSAKTPIRVDEQVQVRNGNANTRWVRVVTQTGARGWVKARDVAEIQ
jgi:hypothetical protein